MIGAPDTFRSGADQEAIARREIRKMWLLFSIGPNAPISLRAISPKGVVPALRPVNSTFTAAHFADLTDRKNAFECEALRLNALGYNVYVVMNAIRSDFAGTKGSGAVCGPDIARRTLLLIDVDRATKAEWPASSAELVGTVAVAKAAAEFLIGIGWPPPIRAFSGNGIHLYWRLDDLPNDHATDHLVKALLHALAKRFDTPQAHIDTAVADAARITKVPGTLARKGAASDDRPYRRAVLIDDHAPRSVTCEELMHATSCVQSATPSASAATKPGALPSAGREPDTPRRRACLAEMLTYISADCEYPDYRNVVWAILSTGWPDAPQLAEHWCRTAPHRFGPEGFDQVINSYDPTRPDRPTLGTITHLAQEGGWNG